MLEKHVEDKIYTSLKMDRLAPDVRKQVMDYMSGETATVKLSPVPGLDDYEVHTAIEQLKGQITEEVLLRYYYVIALLDSEIIFDETHWMLDHYELYYKMGLAPRNVIEGIGKVRVKRWENRPKDVLMEAERIVDDYEKRRNNSLLGQANTYYGSAFRTYVLGQKITNKWLNPLALYIEGMGAVLTEDNESQEMKALEKDLELLIPAIYDNHPHFMPIYDEKQRVRLKAVALSLGILLYKRSNKIYELLCEQLQLIDGEYLEKMLLIPYDKVDKLMEETKMPNAYRVAFYADRMLREYLCNEGEVCHAQLLASYREDSKSVMIAYQTLKKQKKPSTYLLFAFLRARGSVFTVEEVSEVEKLLKEYLIQLALENEGKEWYEKDHRIFQAPLMLYEVSQVAKKQIQELLEGRETSGILAAAEKARKYFYKEMKENILVEMAKEMGVKLILRQAIERENRFSVDTLRELAKQHLDETDELIKEKIKERDERITRYIEVLYTEDIGMKVDTLVSVFNHHRKAVIHFMEEFVVDREHEVRAKMEKLHSIKNKNMQEAFVRLENKWDSEKHIKAIEALRTTQEVAHYIQTIYRPANDKLIPYLEEIEGMMEFRDKEGKELPLVILRYYLSGYMLANKIEPIKPCEAVKKFMDERQLRMLINEMYNRWIQEGSKPKKKNILILYALNAGNLELVALKKQIDEWALKFIRVELGMFAVTAMAMNASSMALMFIDGIARKYRNMEIKKAAAEAMDYVAKVRGLSKEILEDKIVPNLGFNENREIRLSYGTRSFKVKLTPKMDVTLWDEEKQKVIKALPKPGPNDDMQKVLVAQQTFTGLRKQLKTILATQQQRLSKAMLTGRSWEQHSWQELFVKNPIMNGFAMSLIWGEYDSNENLLQTFRYMEDGSLNTLEEEPYKLGEGTVIKLIHPIDLCEAEKMNWKQQLIDYEITQSVVQLDLPIYTLSSEDKYEQTFNKFKGEKVCFGKVLGVMNKYGWEKTEVLDGGRYEGFYFEDEISKISILLKLDRPYWGMPPTETVAIDELFFYKSESLAREDYDEGMQLENNIVPLKDVPVKTLSMGLMIIHLVQMEKE